MVDFFLVAIIFFLVVFYTITDIFLRWRKRKSRLELEKQMKAKGFRQVRLADTKRTFKYDDSIFRLTILTIGSTRFPRVTYFEATYETVTGENRTMLVATKDSLLSVECFFEQV